MTDEPKAEPDPEVPRLPRGRGLRLSRPQLYRIAGTLVLLVFVIVMQKPCSSSVSRFVTGFGPGSAAATMPRPGNVDVPAGSPVGSAGSAAIDLNPDHYEQLRPGMTDDELRQVIERARTRPPASIR